MSNTTLGQEDLSAFWMPFTANRQFKESPRILVSAEGMHYTDDKGNKVLDGSAGLWCVNAGHRNPKIVDAIQKQASELDYAPPFQMGHPKPFEFANKLIKHTPEGLDHVFFTNSGSESVDTALKIAIAYHRLRGEGARQRLIGRDKGYHGVGFGGIAVGGLSNNRKFFGSLIPTDHLPHTLNLKESAFSRGLPEKGAELADELENIIALHDASSLAAVIVEPIAGSAGVIMPPQGYLKKLREICDKHGILLIFDEVITGFGRIGDSFAANRFGVVPDIITSAKGLTSGAVPMGAVFVSDKVHKTFMDNAEGPIEFFHGYTYSGHPLAAAAGLAALEFYEEEGIFERVRELEGYWEDAVHSLKGKPHVIDLRNLGIIAGIHLETIPGKLGARGYQAFLKCLEKGLLTRFTGDIIALSPPLILEKSHIDQIFEIIGQTLNEID